MQRIRASNLLALLTLSLIVTFARHSVAQEKSTELIGDETQVAEFVTHHTIELESGILKYTAVADEVVITDEDGGSKASIFEAVARKSG